MDKEKQNVIRNGKKTHVLDLNLSIIHNQYRLSVFQI
jgi:hypothetical protein